jgi:glutathione peroxidase
MDIKSLLTVIIGLRLLLLTGCTDRAEYKGEAQAGEVAQMQTQAVDNKEIPFETITGDTVSLKDFEVKVVLVVNTASRCGFTKQYSGLEELYREKKDEGFVIIGFPANNFGGQEPGSNEEILNFCVTKFDVTFPMMAKISVKGNDKHPLYKYLTEQSPFPGEIGWNFNKFLLDKKGKVAARYESKVAPDDPQLLAKIDELL